MYIFLSYSRADLEIAEQIAANLKQAGHKVFFDRESIRASEDFHRIIWSEIQKTDLFVFLISPSSTRSGSFALTELMLAEKRWPNPERRVLPVVIDSTELSSIPVYATITHILRPQGNLVAEVRVEVRTLNKRYRLKKFLWVIAWLSGFMLIGWSSYFGYQAYLEQRPQAAREKLVAMDVYNEAAFVDAASRGDLGMIELFLTAGMDPDVTTENGVSALMQAAGNGHYEIVEQLLNAGADVNLGYSGAAPALVWATVQGDDVMVRALLEAGANSASVNDAFSKAASSKTQDKALIKLLLDYGVAQSEIDKSFVEAARNGDRGMLEFLIDKISDRQQLISEGLVAAAETSSVKKPKSFQDKGVEVINYLLEQGADVNHISEKQEFTALIHVAAQGAPMLTKILLEHGADPNIRCSCSGYRDGGWTALTLAIDMKRYRAERDAVINLLLDKGADVNLPQKNENLLKTPLMWASTRGDQQLVRNLLDRGAKVNAQDHSGYTALAYAAGNNEILGELLKRGGDIHLGTNPLLLYMKGYDYYLPAKNLLEVGVDVNKPNQEGQTPLMQATQKGDPDLVRMLLGAGARISDKDKMGRTALIFAKRSQNKELVDLLQKAAE